MAKELKFEKNETGKWEASIESEGVPMAIEINREKAGSLLIYGNLEGLEKVVLENYGPSAEKHHLVEVDVPAGVKITIESYTEVRGASAV